MPEIQTRTTLQRNLSVLITGGSGLIGRHLTSILLDEGYNVMHLSRKGNQAGKVRVFKWNPQKRTIDPEVFEGVDFIVHLAGANIGEKRWTGRRKKEIMDSRVDSAVVLHKIIIEKRIRLKAFISASATGIYGYGTSSDIFSEIDPPATDFLGTVCKKWEEAADLFNSSGIRTVKIRSAIVLDKSDSALSELMKPARFGFLIKAGSGQQYIPWIHPEDLCKIYLKAIKDPAMSGVYNAVAPQHVTHSDFMHSLAKIMKLPVFPVSVPGFVLRVVLGEMSDLILRGSRVSSEKIMDTGYRFLYSTLEDALNNIIPG